MVALKKSKRLIDHVFVCALLQQRSRGLPFVFNSFMMEVSII